MRVKKIAEISEKETLGKVVNLITVSSVLVEFDDGTKEEVQFKDLQVEASTNDWLYMPDAIVAGRITVTITDA